MKNIYSDFTKFSLDSGIPSMNLDQYSKYMSTVINPTILEERKLNVAQMDVFSRLLYDNIIFIGDSIDRELANIIQAQLLYLSNAHPDTDISIYINSGGGIVSDGLAIYDTMQIVSPDIATICTGEAASMAAVLLSAGTKGKRSILPHSEVMIHQPSGGMRGQVSDLSIHFKTLQRCKTVLYNILSLHTGQSIKKITKDADRDYWMTANEAISYGIVDKIITKKQKIVKGD